MLFQFMLTTFFKSELLSCLQKVLSCDQLTQKAFHYKKPLSNISDKSDKLGNFSIKTVQNLPVNIIFSLDLHFSSFIFTARQGVYRQWVSPSPFSSDLNKC